MSDIENMEDGPVRRKRSRLSKPSKSSLINSEFSGLPSARKRAVLQDVSVNSPDINLARSQEAEEDSIRFDSSSAGVIKKIKLVNFMCHSHFEIKLNPRINFVSGCNGSGKSAIQTGLVIGLGGSALKTNRGSKIESLIKHGCSSGSITIHLANTGMNAYKPTEYGNEIQIIRNLTTTSSSYRILNQWGKIMSNKKKELDNICLRLRIQPNNPIAVLNQDMARNFLATNRAESKYQLFKQATLLDEAEKMLTEILQDLDEQEGRIEAKQRAIQQIADEIEKMTEQIDLSRQVREKKEAIFSLENELLWSRVNDRRRELSNFEEILEGHQNSKSQLEQEVEEIKTRIEELTRAKQEVQEQLANVQSEFRSKEEITRKLRAEYEKTRSNLDHMNDGLRTLESNIKKKVEDKEYLRRNIDVVEKQEKESEHERRKTEAEMIKMREKLTDQESEFKALEQEQLRKRGDVDHYDKQLRERQYHAQQCKNQIASLEAEVRGHGASDELERYGRHMPKLVALIDEAVRARKFSQPPRGPLGRYIKVQDPKWMYVIEKHIGTGMLCSFQVNCMQDRNLLLSIAQRACQVKPMVHLSEFTFESQRDGVRRSETTAPGYTNIHNVLSFSDTVVENFVSEYSELHKILLVEEPRDCRDFFKPVERLPKNCRQILDKNCDQYMPGFRVYANNDRSRVTRILQQSADEHLRLLKREIAAKQEALREAMSGSEELRRQYELAKSQERHLLGESKQKLGILTSIKRRMRDLKEKLEMEGPTVQGQLEELHNIDREITELQAKKEKCKEKIEELNGKVEELKRQRSAMTPNDTFDQQSALNAKVAELETELETRRRTQEKTIKNVQELVSKIELMMKRVRETEQKLATEQDSASQIAGTTDCETERTSREIQEEINEMEACIEEAKKKLGTNEIDFQADYWQKKTAQKAFLGLFEDLKKMHEKLKHMCRERRGIIVKIRDVASNVIVATFQRILQSRNYEGKLIFDHDKQKLDIFLTPTDGGGDNVMMSTESLSGGEKSFSTVAFLMSLWSNMELPFYSMDEYDVFMDAINRKAITKLLMSFAFDNSARQFIFLTPLDVSIIETGRNVQVHRVRKLQNQ